MNIWIKNAGTQERTWLGKVVSPGEYYKIGQFEALLWRESNEVFQDIAYGFLRVSKTNDPSGEFLNAVEGWSYLLGELPSKVQNKNFPFADKTLPEGNKLFRRKHGTLKNIPANSTEAIQITIPYTMAKFNKAEIINGSPGDVVNLKVYDNEFGTIQQTMGVPAQAITPNLFLNQFGFNVAVCKDYYEDESNYDADVIQGMIIEVEYTNNSASEVLIGVNITLHEIV